jgi:hypothetical protein
MCALIFENYLQAWTTLMKGALSWVQASMYSVVAPRELLTVRYAASMIFYTDGFLIDGRAGFAFSPAGIFTAELTALFETLHHIEKVIQPPERCLILTDDSLS